VSLLVDRYELGPRLGTGGMATVVAGHDRVLDRPVAIKLLGRHQPPDARARLLREARAAARLHHPNVVAVYDTGEHDGQPFIVMELVRGRTLADELHTRGGWTSRRRSASRSASSTASRSRTRPASSTAT
jgi:eukaryotic-like serine/threonine-protein kinase